MTESDRLDELPSEELYRLALDHAKHHLDVGFFWNLLKVLPAAEAAAGEWEDVEADVQKLGAHLDDLTDAGRGEVADNLRPFYLDYLREHGVQPSWGMGPKQFPDFDLALAGGGRLTRADLSGKPWIAYLARHPGWSICQRHLRRAAEAHEDIRARDATLVVVFNADVEIVEDWRRTADLPAEALVVADPGAALYRELGTERMDPLRLVIKGLTGAVRSAVEGIWPRATKSDMLRLGADVAVDADGNIALLHLASSADDRLPIQRLIEALDGARLSR